MTDSLQVLNYHSVRSSLSGFCLSRSAAERALIVEPFVSEDEVRRQLTLTEEAFLISFEYADSPVRGFDSVKDALAKVEKGGVLDTTELYRVSALLRTAESVKTAILRYDDERIYELQRIAVLITHADDLAKRLAKSLASPDELSDDASTELAAARNKIRMTQRKIKDRLNGMLRSQQFTSHLRDRLVTMRDNRYVFPVKAESKSSVPGIVHDVSDSGATLYIEPMAIVDYNNTLRAAMVAEQEEVAKVLFELSRAVAVHLDVLINNEHYLTELDLIFARARYASVYKCVRPEICEVGTLSLVRARHPLIAKEKIVPTTLDLLDGKTLLLISGPNTGGKTVALKTVGLMCLMAYSGMFVPCESAKIPFFERIYCDVGDNQSIEENLSTFSSHIANLKEIIDHCTPSHLVLLDELGAGTDPAEGAALAVSIVRDLAKRGVTSIVTTHFSELKEFGLMTDCVRNASMEFDPVTLTPTYRLKMGLPGVSNALNVASMLGLREDIVAYAKEYIGQGKRTFEEVLQKADDARVAADREREELAREKERLAADVRLLQQERDKVAAQYERLTVRAQNEIDRLVDHAMDKAERIIEEMEELAKADAAQNLLAAKQLRTRLQDTQGVVEHEDDYLPITADEIKVGDTVVVRSLSANGKVRSLPDRKGKVDVAIGNMVLNLKLADLAKQNFAKKQEEARAAQRARHATSAGATPAVTSINLLGQTVDEAILNVDAFLDNALLHGIVEVKVIHGIGTGALKKGLHEHFRKHRNVAEYRSGGYGEGGYGVTILKLK